MHGESNHQPVFKGVNNATRSDALLGYAHGLIGDPMFYGTAIRPLTAGFTAYYRF
jgi:hypothetical protein